MRAVPRFPLPKEKMKFVFEEGEKVFAVRDISVRGLGIDLPEFGDSLYFPVGYRCQAELRLEARPLVVEVEVARVNAWSAGFVFSSLSEDQAGRLHSFVDPLHAGQTLKACNPQEAEPDFGAGVSAWYRGEANSHLLLWIDQKGSVARALLAKGARFWEWSAETGVSTGFLERSSGAPARLVRDPEPDEQVRALARKVLEHAEVLDYRLARFLGEKA